MGDFFHVRSTICYYYDCFGSIGFCGALIGVKLRKMKDAKTKRIGDSSNEEELWR